ncbi:MAG: CpsD/CapB family tyrosine-protein kinase [Candidatus Binatia bacterium]
MEGNRDNEVLDVVSHGETVRAESGTNPDRPKRRRRRKSTRRTLSKRILKGIDPHVVSLTANTSIEAEQYRTICSRLEQIHKEDGVSVIAVTSPAAGDGKSLTSINIAGTLAQFPGTQVLLIDMDLRRPSIAKYLGIPASHVGLVDLVGGTDLVFDETVRTYDPFRLTVLPAGRPFATPHEVLKSQQFESLLNQVRSQFDYVILDLPPMLPFPDARLLENWIDGLVMVVGANHTPRKLLEEALNLVNPDKLCGMILNNDDYPLFGYYTYYTYYYYTSPFIDEPLTTKDRLLTRLRGLRAAAARHSQRLLRWFRSGERDGIDV